METFYTRIVNKHDTEANWNNNSSFIPMQGETIIYDIDDSYTFQRMKIGDGVTTVTNLPFVNIADERFDEIMEELKEIKELAATGGNLPDITAAPEDVLATKTYNDGNGEVNVGTMVNNSGANKMTDAISSDPTNKIVKLSIPSNAVGYYNDTSNICASFSDMATHIGLTATKIVSGNTILGIAGTATTGIPDGLTVTPVNDITIWQKCAGLATTYTTVAQVLADTVTLKSLLQNANAMEYLIRSTTIQEAVLANSTAVSYLDKSMPYINPDMVTTSLPYGTVTTTSDNNGGNLFKAFNTNESSGYIASGAGKYIEWKTSGNTKGHWGYKVTVQDTYGTDAQVKFQGIDVDGNVF